MVIEQAHKRPLAIQTDWVRINGQAVAAAASLGLITTAHAGGYGRLWRPTAEGLELLEEVYK